MNSASAFAAITAAIAIGAMSPGPSFIVVARLALTKGRLAGVLAALGMGLAGLLFATLAVAGLATMPPPLLLALKFVGALYLGYIGVQIIRHATNPLEISAGHGARKSSLLVGFVTQVSNPKTIVVYASVFGALLPAKPETWLFIALPLAVGAIELTWYIVVATLFSTAKTGSIYEKAKPLVDRVVGGIMILLALRLLFTL